MEKCILYHVKPPMTCGDYCK